MKGDLDSVLDIPLHTQSGSLMMGTVVYFWCDFRRNYVKTATKYVLHSVEYKILSNWGSI